MLNEIAVVGGEDMESDGVSGVEMDRVDGGNGAAQRNGARRQLDVDDLGPRNAGEGGITMAPNYRKLQNNRRKKLNILFLSLTECPQAFRQTYLSYRQQCREKTS